MDAQEWSDDSQEEYQWEPDELLGEPTEQPIYSDVDNYAADYFLHTGRRLY